MKKIVFNKELVNKNMLLIVDNNLLGKNKIIFSKFLKINSKFLNTVCYIYKGCFYRKLKIYKYILGFRFGEFCYTRKPFRYQLKSKK